MVWRFLKKLGIKPPYDPAIPLLGIYPEETKIEKDTYIVQVSPGYRSRLLAAQQLCLKGLNLFGKEPGNIYA